LEFGDSVTPVSILSRTGGDNRNVLAVHSLSKRSNLAGYRAAFIVGDPELIKRIREIRKHAGMMVSLPVQRAMEIALTDDTHVESQRARYIRRRSKLVSALIDQGFTLEKTQAGLYIWTTRGEKDMDTVAWFAQLGILVTPGHFYGEKGANHIRLAMTATDALIDEAVVRLQGSS
jgi:aspartate/methionine/tyrosine aminotransferase